MIHASIFLAGMITALGVGPALLPHPASELHAATSDLVQHVPPHERRSTRYLSLYSIPVERRGALLDALSFALNSVSRAATLKRPYVVAGSDQRLVRISLVEYGLPEEVWELLASREPFWHLRTRAIDPRSGVKPALVDVFTDGGWVGLDQAARLRQLTGSGGAILRADYFLHRATTTLNGGVYYELADIAETEIGFLRALGIDVETIDRLRADEGANLFVSQVTYKVRRVLRRQGPLGGVWQTYDVANSSPQRDPFRNPFEVAFDASEYVVAKKNGLHLFALFDQEGNRQASVPDLIAKDTSDRHGAGIVVPMISCVRCHLEDGLRPFVNDQRRLLSRQVELLVDKPENAERLAAFYETDLDKRLRRDREDYADAVRACAGGRGSAEIAGLLSSEVAEYFDTPVNADRAARELGVFASRLPEVLSRSHDPVLLALAAGLSVQREQWEASYAEAALLAADVLSSSR